MTITLTYEQALEGLKRAVEEKGEDYTYKPPSNSGCAYFTGDGQPSCIVGHVLAQHGLTKEDLVGDWPNWHNSSLNAAAGVRPLYDNGVIDVDDDALRLLDLVQVAQDNGDSWGEAIQKGVAHNA